MKQLNQNQIAAIKGVMETQGWKEVKQLLKEEAYNLRTAKNINTDRDFKDIAVEAMGKAYACRVIDRWLNSLDGLKQKRLIDEKHPLI